MIFTTSWIIFVSILTVCFFGVLIFSNLLCNPIDDMKFSFLRIFPFEVERNTDKPSVFRTIIYLFICLSFSSLFLFNDVRGSLYNLSPILFVTNLALGFASICFLFLIIFDVTHVKVHLIIFTLFLSLILLGDASLLIYGFTANKVLLANKGASIPLYICSGFAGIFAILILLIALNPKLMVWAKLDKVEGNENEYRRPKKFPLAYSEWALFVLLYLSELLLYFELIIQ